MEVISNSPLVKQGKLTKLPYRIMANQAILEELNPPSLTGSLRLKNDGTGRQSFPLWYGIYFQGANC